MIDYGLNKCYMGLHKLLTNFNFKIMFPLLKNKWLSGLSAEILGTYVLVVVETVFLYL